MGNDVRQPREKVLSIREGEVYVFRGPMAEKCIGHVYRALRFVTHVPVYQCHVLVECLSGPDLGLWFTCSLANFAGKYREMTAVERVAWTESQRLSPGNIKS